MRLFGLIAMLTLMSCTEVVPAGYKGRVQLAGGWSNELVNPGRATCYGRDILWLVETRDVTVETPLQVLLQKDKVNFGVTVALTFTLKTDKEVVLPLFDKVRPDGEKENTITLDGVFKTYASPVLNSVPKQIIRAYTVEEILSATTEIEQEVMTQTTIALEASPINPLRISLVNLDFPEFITKAQERAKEAEIKIKEEENKQKARLVEEENKRKIAEVQYQTQVLEAKTIADSNRLIGESLVGAEGGAFLRWHEIKVYGSAAEGPNNCIFLPMNMFSQGIAQYEAGMTPLRRELSKALKPPKAVDIKVPVVPTVPSAVEVPKVVAPEDG